MSHRKNINSKCGWNNMRVNKIMTEFQSFCTLALDTEISVYYEDYDGPNLG